MLLPMSIFSLWPQVQSSLGFLVHPKSRCAILCISGGSRVSAWAAAKWKGSRDSIWSMEASLGCGKRVSQRVHQQNTLPKGSSSAVLAVRTGSVSIQEGRPIGHLLLSACVPLGHCKKIPSALITDRLTGMCELHRATGCRTPHMKGFANCAARSGRCSHSTGLLRMWLRKRQNILDLCGIWHCIQQPGPCAMWACGNGWENSNFLQSLYQEAHHMADLPCCRLAPVLANEGRHARLILEQTWWWVQWTCKICKICFILNICLTCWIYNIPYLPRGWWCGTVVTADLSSWVSHNRPIYCLFWIQYTPSPSLKGWNWSMAPLLAVGFPASIY